MAVMRRALLTVVLLVAITVSAAPSIQAHANKTPGYMPAAYVCQYTTETDNIFVSYGSENPYVDYYYANGQTLQWDVYYDIKRDNSTGVACSMRVVVRIFPPNNQSWSGNVGVQARYESNMQWITASWGQLMNGYTVYPSHLVFRGPWFGAGAGAYYIYSDNLYPDGSVQGTRADTLISV